MSKTVQFNAEVLVASASYSITSSLKENLWYSSKEVNAFKNDPAAYFEDKLVSKDRRLNYVHSVLAQQEEHREELGTSDEKGLRMFACTLSKHDTKKALQKARLAALDAHDVHYEAALTFKSFDEYSKATATLSKRRSSGAFPAASRRSLTQHSVVPKAG
jgi:hypothetical protein